MEEMDPVLKALAMVTTATCGEEAVSMSVVYRMVCGLMNEHLQTSGGHDKVATFVNTARITSQKVPPMGHYPRPPTQEAQVSVT